MERVMKYDNIDDPRHEHSTLEKWQKVVRIKEGTKGSHVWVRIVSDWEFHVRMLQDEIDALHEELQRVVHKSRKVSEYTLRKSFTGQLDSPEAAMQRMKSVVH